MLRRLWTILRDQRGEIGVAPAPPATPATPAPAPEPVASVSPAVATPSPAPAGVDWSTYIPPEYAKDKLWEPLKGKDLATVLKGYAEGQKARGSSISLPGKDATPEQLAAFHADLTGKLSAAGLVDVPPAKAEDYQIERPPIVAELGWSDEREGGFKTVAHGLGLTQEQVQGLVNWYAKDGASLMQAGNAAVDEATAALAEEWGGNFEAKMGRAEQFVSAYFDAPTREAIKKTVGKLPGFVKGMVAAGSRMAEHGDLPGTVDGQMTSEEIDSKIASLREKSKTLTKEVDRIANADEIHALFQQKLGDNNPKKFTLG